MHARLEAFSRAVTWFNNRTTPSGMRRLNRYLVLHRPVLWRSRLIWVAWWSILLSLVLAGVGYWIARSALSLWATEDLLQLLAFARYTTVVLAIIWAVVHLRIPLGELAFLRHAGAAAANLLVILLMFLPGHALGIVAGYTGAHLLTVREVVELRPYLDKLEHCATDAKNEHQAATTLQRLGLRRRATVDSTGCDPFLVWQLSESERGNSEFENAAHPGQIRDRLDSIADSQSFWHASSGNLYENCVRPWRFELLAAFGGALLLGILGYPASAWRRRLGISIHPGGRWAIPMPRVGWLESLDQRLLTRSPLIWAARVHYLLPTVASLLAAALALNLVERSWSPKADWDIIKWAVSFAVGLWPFAWQIARRTDIGQVLPARWQAVTATSLAAVLCIPLLMFAVSWVVEKPEMPLFLGAWGAVFGTWTAGYVLVRAYKTRFQTFLLEAVAFCVAFILAVLALESVLVASSVCLAFGAAGVTLWLMERASRSPAWSRPRAWGAALCLLMFPALVISLVLVVFAPVRKGLPNSLLVPCVVITSTLAIAALYLLALRPFVRALALAERAPKSD